MPRHVRLRELLVGVEGLALLRHLYDGSEEAAQRRLAEVAALLADERLADGEPILEVGPRAGYGAWSQRYDEPGNPVVALEQDVVWALIDACPAARALDAACGTGRHAEHLADRGHEVLGFDLTPEMLALASRKVAGARFVEGDLLAIPAADAQFELVVCGLALSHLEDLRGAVAELRRVLAGDGRLVISVLHPFQAHLGWHSPFTDAGGRRAFIREHPHSHAEYLAAFRAAGLEVLDCIEPVLSAELVRTKRRAFEHVPEAALEAYEGLPGVLVWELRGRVTDRGTARGRAG